MDVVLVRGGWSCEAGYIQWAYVAKAKPPDESRKGRFVGAVNVYEMSRIGERLFEPPTSRENSPTPIVEKWIKDNGHNLITNVTMRTD